MLYRPFIDDSSDEKQEDVVTAGAVIAAHGDWQPVTKKWNARLRQDGLAYFRSAEYYALRGQFERFRDPIKYPKPTGSQAAKKLRDDLEAILKDAPVVGIGVAIPLKLYREFRATVLGAAGKFGEDAFYSALQTLMIECAYTVRDELPRDKKGRDNRIAFACDSTDRAPMYTAAFVDFKKRNPELAQIMGGLVHVDDKRHPPIQAADMMASLTKELALPVLTDAVQIKTPLPVSSNSEAPRLKGTAYKIVIWDYEWMTRLLTAQYFGAVYSDALHRSLEKDGS
jgi:hypothetical protein